MGTVIIKLFKTSWIVAHKIILTGSSPWILAWRGIKRDEPLLVAETASQKKGAKEKEAIGCSSRATVKEIRWWNFQIIIIISPSAEDRIVRKSPIKIERSSSWIDVDWIACASCSSSRIAYWRGGRYFKQALC